MNLYLLVEGERCEPVVYRSWIEHTFPALSRVGHLDFVEQNHFFIFKGCGYPAYVERIKSSLKDIADRPVIDHFFVCVDAEDWPHDQRLMGVQRIVNEELAKTDILLKKPDFRAHVIVQNCCIETWFLGHAGLLPAAPRSESLADLRAFYDVSLLDPEDMPRRSGHLTRARFHKHYLREMLREGGKSYSEQRPGIVRDAAYLEALRQRCNGTGHLGSLQKLLSVWEEIGTPPPALA